MKNVNESQVVVRMGQFKDMAKKIAVGTIEKSPDKKVMGFLRAMGKKVRLDRDSSTRSGLRIVIEDVDEASILRTKYKRTDKRSVEKDRKKAVKTYQDIRKGKYPGVKFANEDVELDEAKVRGADAYDKTFANRKQADKFAREMGGRVKQIGRVFYVFKEGWRSGGGGYRDPFKAARRDAKYKELSHEYEDEKKLARLKQMRKTQQQKKEEVELDEATTVSRADFDKLKKGSMITIDYGSSVSRSNKRTFQVKSKTRSAKYNVDKVNMVDPQKPGGMKFHLYSRGGGDATLALGDMGATINSYSIKESVDEAALKTSDYPKGTSMSAQKFKDSQKKMSKQRALTTKDYPKGTSMSATAWKNRQEEVELDEGSREADIKKTISIMKKYPANKGKSEKELRKGAIAYLDQFINKNKKTDDYIAKMKAKKHTPMEEREFHVRLDHLDGDSRQKKVDDILRKYEKKSVIKYSGSTDKGLVFVAKNSSGLSSLNRELNKYQTFAEHKGLPEMKTFESIRRAMDIAKKSGGAMTPAVKKMDKIKKGVSDNPRVQKALKKANEGAMSKDKEKHDTGGFRISNADAKAARDRLAAKRKQKDEEVDTGQYAARKKPTSSKQAQQSVFDKHRAAMQKLRDAPKGSPWMKKAGKDAKMLRYVLNRDVK